MSTLLLRLAAPLQSWGSDSKYDIRRTDSMPTKSGVVGLLAAALGRERGESLEDLAALRFGVRVDSHGQILQDFQVAKMGEKLNANISYRQYLSDAVFLVGFESSDRAFLEGLEFALKHPVFPLFLGRRSCPPTLPLCLGIREQGLYEALCAESPQRELKKQERASLRIVMDAKGQGTAVKRDVPVSYSSYARQYQHRYLLEMPPCEIGGTDPLLELAETDHDPMIELR